MAESGDGDDAESHISSFSGGGNCVRVTRLPTGEYLVSHSQEDRPGVTFSREQWEAFVAGVKAEEFDF